MAERRPILKRTLFALLAVCGFFAAVEIALWLGGVRPLLAERDPFQGFSQRVQVFEADDSRRLFVTPQRSVRHSFNYQEFALDKPDDGFRFFVVGGSSAFGFPWGARVAFTRVLNDALRVSLPERTVEGVNAGAMSYGSHRLRLLVPELMRYRPDLLVVYGGHNEFVESRLRNLRHPPGGFERLLFRSRLYALMTRAYESVARSRRVAPEPGEQTTGELLGLDVDREVPTDVRRTEREAAEARFEDNLRAVLESAREAGVTVMLCTVPSNIRDWVPNASLFDDSRTLEQRRELLDLVAQGRDALAGARPEEAVRVLEHARELAPEYAEVHFRLGQAYQALERWDEARQAYGSARDTDGQPTRASSEINAAIRRLGDERGVLLVDVEREFESFAPHGLVGFNLFEDYVHPNRRGHRLIAYALWRAALERGLAGPPQPATLAEFAEILRVREDLTAETDALLAETGLPGRTPDMLFNLAVVLENQGLIDEAIRKYRECLELRPLYWLARENLARLLFKQGRWSEAAESYRVVNEQLPDRIKTLIGLGESLRRLDQVDEAMQVLGRATEIEPDSAAAWNSLGGALAQRNRQAEAEAAFRRAAELDPRAADTQVNLGLALLFQKKLDEAEVAFERSLELRPYYVRARDGLAAVLTERGELDEAERMFRENLELEPDDSFAAGGLRVIERRRAEPATPDGR